MKVKGVNLGNWLVLEKWMNPALFEGTTAEDEYWLPRQLSKEVYEARIKIHRSEYITERDFVTIKSWGLDAVRIPVPYFIFGDREPFIGCIEDLDKAFNWAEKYGLKILIDLHTAPEGQNGSDNGGICGVCKWAQNPEEVEFVHTVLERLAQRYGHREGLWGIELINEPALQGAWELLNIQKRYPPVDEEMAKGSAPITVEFIRKFYLDAYDRIEKYLSEDKYIVIHDGFELTIWKDFMREEKYKNVVLDTHQYLMMAEMMGCEQTVEGYEKYVKEHFMKEIEEMQQYLSAVSGVCLILLPVVGILREDRPFLTDWRVLLWRHILRSRKRKSIRRLQKCRKRPGIRDLDIFTGVISCLQIQSTQMAGSAGTAGIWDVVLILDGFR